MNSRYRRTEHCPRFDATLQTDRMSEVRLWTLDHAEHTIRAASPTALPGSSDQYVRVGQ